MSNFKLWSKSESLHDICALENTKVNVSYNVIVKFIGDIGTVNNISANLE